MPPKKRPQKKSPAPKKASQPPPARPKFRGWGICALLATLIGLGAVAASAQKAFQMAEGGGDSWIDSLRSGQYFRDRRSESSRSSDSRERSRERSAARSEGRKRERSAQRASATRVGALSQDWSAWGKAGNTHRTLCVRLCDGFYWPINFAATRGEFERDAAVCQKSCNSPVALYTYPNPGGTPEEMVSLEGEPYASLKNAFVYRISYRESCKCKPHPWEKEAQEQHATYAREEAQAAADVKGEVRPTSARH
jgi:hypothetical protein